MDVVAHADATTIEDAEEKRHRKEELKRRRKHRKQRHRNTVLAPNYDIPGVVRVVLTETTQKIINCIVGAGVTSERPWTTVRKSQLEDLVESDEQSEFIKYKQEILEYPRDILLLGYVPDESRDTDEFFFCTTPECEDQVKVLISDAAAAQHARLENTIHKLVKPWRPLGSDLEVQDYIYKNNRPLYKVEMVTSYPVLSSKVQFRSRFVKDVRDGYLELVQPAKYIIPSITKRRIDAFCQVAPLCNTREAQTDCTFPKNQWTQYQYEYNKIDNLSKEWTNNFRLFVDTNMDLMSDDMLVNSNINLYDNDYLNLVKDTMYTVVPKERNQAEYIALADIKNCKDKLITSIAWHPTCSGIVALAYAFSSPYSYQHGASKRDIVGDSVNGFHAVLIWSFKDGLYPKLLLESNNEIHKIEFCPHDGNLLVGGLSSGQVILWDIRNKLEKVEEEEILTGDQQKYRVLMFSLMKWMKNTKDISRVRPTVISDLNCSHNGFINGIQWLHPYYEVSKTGHMQVIEENNDAPFLYSLQFASTSIDGSVLFWDLRAKPIFQPGDYKPQRKSRRLKRRPTSLTQDVSPFRILHRVLKPVFRITLTLPRGKAPVPFSYSHIPVEQLEYSKVNPEAHLSATITDRLIYMPIIEMPEIPEQQKIILTSYLGEFIVATWEGFDYSSGDIIPTQSMKFVNIGRYHDGPIVTVNQHPFIPDVYLSVGGKVFCIWKENLKERPIMWRRSRCKYTHGSWSIYNPTIIMLNRSDGNTESWHLAQKTDSFQYEVSYSGNTLLSSKVHPRKIKKNVIGISDDKGCLRLIYVPSEELEFTDLYESKEFLIKLLNSNVQRKNEFLMWQDEWMSVHASWIKQMKEDAKAEAKRIEDEKEAELQKAEDLAAQLAKEEAHNALLKSKPQPGHYIEWAQEQWIINEQDRVANIMLSKKGLNKDMLMKQQMPMKLLEKQEEKKKQKQKERLSKADQIFNDTIAMLFPDLAQEKDVVKQDPYHLLVESEEVQLIYFNAYHQVHDETDDFVADNPFEYTFDWNEVMFTNQDKKRKNENNIHKSGHRHRHESEKKSREVITRSYVPVERVQTEQSIDFGSGIEEELPIEPPIEPIE